MAAIVSKAGQFANESLVVRIRPGNVSGSGHLLCVTGHLPVDDHGIEGLGM
jgi:hypothetical protein